MVFTKAQKQSVRSLTRQNRSRWRGIRGVAKDASGNVLVLPPMHSDSNKKR